MQRMNRNPSPCDPTTLAWPGVSPAQARPPAVSVVIPARNAALTLAQTLLSVQRQHFCDWEAIVVDDGSTDVTDRIVAEAARDDGRFRRLHTPGLGVSAARNAGVAAARGALIAFLDADDLWLPDKLGAHVDQFAAAPDVGLSFSRVAFVDVHGRPTGVLSTERVQGLRPSDLLYENPACTASTLVVRRRLLEEIGGFDEQMRFAEDLELMLRAACRTRWGIEGLPRVLVHYRASPRGASAALPAMQAGWETLLDKVRGYAPEIARRHGAAARAVHLRYLARRALRLGQPAPQGLRFFAQAVANSPWALLREPRRTFGTLVALLMHLLRLRPAATDT